MPFTNGTATYQLIQFDTFNRLQNSLSVALIRLWFGLLFFSREFCPLHTFVVFQFFIHRNNWTGFHHFWPSGQTTSKLTFSRNRIRCTLNSIFALCFFFWRDNLSLLSISVVSCCWCFCCRLFFSILQFVGDRSVFGWLQQVSITLHSENNIYNKRLHFERKQCTMHTRSFSSNGRLMRRCFWNTHASFNSPISFHFTMWLVIMLAKCHGILTPSLLPIRKKCPK